MKKLVIALVVLVAICLIAPYGIGRVAEQRVNAGLDKLVEQAPYFKIAKREWTGGWFRSEQVLTLEISEAWAKALVPPGATEAVGKALSDDAADEAGADVEAAGEAEPTEPSANEGADEDAVADGETESPAEESAAPAVAESLSFTVRNEVLHGPVLGFSGLGLARVDTYVDLPEKARAEIAEVFGEKPALQVRTRVGFFGGGTTTFTSEGRKLNTKGEGELSYETFKLSVGVGRDGSSYDVDGKWPGFTATGKEGGTFSMDDMTIDADGERIVGDIYDGEFAFKVKEFKLQENGDAAPVVISGAHYLGEALTKDDLMNLGLKLGTGAISGSTQLQQANIDIKEIHYDFSLRRLHVPTIDKMSQSFKKLYAQPMVDAAQAEKAIFGPFKEHAGELLAHDPELSIDRLGFVTPEGEIVAKGVIKFVGATPEDFTPAAAMALIGKIDADFTIEAAQKVVEKLPNGATMAGGAVDAGYAKRDGDKLVCHITFKAGELLINGKPQAIPGLGGPPPAAMEEGAGEEVPQE
jgi:uncharacterized protein YdgA (DUF945 family)